MSGIIGERQFRSPSRAKSSMNLRNMSGIIGERQLRSRSKAKSSSNLRYNNVTDDTAFTSTRVTSTTSTSFSVNGNHSERTEVSNHADNIYDSGGNIQDDGGGQNRYEEGDNPWVNGQFKSPEEVRDYYKSFGDWWNYFPKTDNSYDPTSKWFGLEVAPGIPTIPNMARQPLHPLSRKSSLERFFQRSSNQSGEVVSVTSSNSRIINFFYKIITTITTIITTVWYRVTNFASVNSSASSSSNNVSNSKALHSTTVVDSEVYVWWKAPFRWLYRLSTWLFMTGVWVQSVLNRRFSRIRSIKHKYLKFIILLLLLPLIALLGWFYYTKSSDNVAVLCNDVASSVNEHLNISASFFRNFFNNIAASFFNISDSLIGSFSYIYSLLPVFVQYFKSSATETPHGSIDNEQLSILVQQTVRDVLQKDSAILLENTVNHPRFKVLMEEALAEKSGSWDPSELLASDEWKAAVRDVVEQHYHENFKMDALEEHIRSIELKADQSVDELTKLKEFSSKLHEKIIALEKHIHLVLEQFVTVEHLEKTIQNLTLNLQYQGKIDEEHVIEKILSDVTVKVKEDITTLFKSIRENHHKVEITNADINFDQVKDYVSLMIERALALYDADKIGMVDYALESSGGNVVSTRCTESYSAGHRTYVLFGFALWHRSNSPRTVIQPGVQPGECWAFAGQQGYIVLQLSATIVVTAFTVEHIPRSLAPQGRINSAPKDFSVWGLKYESDMDPVFLGRFHFMENGTSLQKFEAEHVQEPFRLVELKIESNHGNLDYTCLYRFRVHGIPVS